MRSSLLLIGAVSLAGIAAVVACGESSGESVFGDKVGGDPPPNSTEQPCVFGCTDDDGGSTAGVSIESMRIEPADATITVDPGKTATQTFKVFAKMKGQTTEQEFTSSSVFYVPDNFLVGTFPADGKPTFTTRLPASETEPPQRGGKLTVQAQAANSDGTVTTVTTSLTVKVSPLTLSQPNASPALPTNPGTLFTTLDPDTNSARHPKIAYPNDGVMLPPNLRRLGIHWDPGTGNKVFELKFVGSNTTVTYYARCVGTDMAANKCGFELDQAAYAWVAASNNAGSVKLKIRGTAEAGGTYGESQEITLNFAENNVEGGLYYWGVITDAIGKVMRVDFGNPNSNPEPFVLPPEAGLDKSVDCVGCHAISRDGTKLVASVGGRWDGRLVYLNDLSKAKPDGGAGTAADAGWATQNGAWAGDPAKNRVQFASFNPQGTQFAAVFGDIGNVGDESWLAPDELMPKNPSPGVKADIPADMDPNSLFFHDGTTGLRVSSKKLAFKPDHPDWSPDGTMIAVTHVGGSQTATQRPSKSGIDILKQQAGGWADPEVVVPSNVAGKNRYNPSFAPDSSFFLYSESTCPGAEDGIDCDGDSDPSAKTFAVKPAAGQTPVLLSNANALGIADGTATGTQAGDTFPRMAPFKTKHKDGTLIWATVASRRAPGYHLKPRTQALWMFAIDPAKVLAGEDGSYKAFYLPFQDFDTSNHIAQWTEKIVGGNAPPPPAPPAAPPAPPQPH